MPRNGKQKANKPAPKRPLRVVDDDDVEQPEVRVEGVVLTEEQVNEQVAALEAAERAQAAVIGAGPSSAGSASAKTTPKKKKKKVSLENLSGFQDLKSGKSGSDNSGFKKKRKIEATTRALRHQSGAKKGQLTGRVGYLINCAFEDNAAFQELCKRIVHSEARWVKDFLKWCVVCPTAEIAIMLHNALLADSNMAETVAEVNKVLDTSAYKTPGIEKPKFTVATSELQFETERDGVLPESHMIMGTRTYDFKEFLKAYFEEIRYLDLVFNGGTVKKAAWVLPAGAETERTGTLADFLRRLGADVDEVELDGDDDEDDDAERDEDGLVDDEAEEDDGEEDAEDEE